MAFSESRIESSFAGGMGLGFTVRCLSVVDFDGRDSGSGFLESAGATFDARNFLQIFPITGGGDDSASFGFCLKGMFLVC